MKPHPLGKTVYYKGCLVACHCGGRPNSAKVGKVLLADEEQL